MGGEAFFEEDEREGEGEAGEWVGRFEEALLLFVVRGEEGAGDEVGELFGPEWDGMDGAVEGGALLGLVGRKDGAQRFEHAVH